MPSVFVLWRTRRTLSNVLRVQIDLHFTKVREILFKNFCSLAPVAIAVGSEATYRYSMRSSIDLWRTRHTLYFIYS